MAVMLYLKQSARFVVRNTLDFGNHKDASIVEDNIDVTESRFVGKIPICV